MEPGVDDRGTAPYGHAPTNRHYAPCQSIVPVRPSTTLDFYTRAFDKIKKAVSEALQRGPDI